MPKIITDVQVWEDPDVDATIFENAGGIQFAGDNMLIIVDGEENILAAFNNCGWFKFEITKRNDETEEV